MPLDRDSCSTAIKEAAADLEERLEDAGKKDLIGIVIKFYTYTRMTADLAELDKSWLRDIICLHDFLYNHTPDYSCDRAYHQLIRFMIEPRFLSQCNLQERIIGSIWEALGSFNNEDAAARADEEDDEDNNGDKSGEEVVEEEAVEEEAVEEEAVEEEAVEEEAVEEEAVEEEAVEEEAVEEEAVEEEAVEEEAVEKTNSAKGDMEHSEATNIDGSGEMEGSWSGG
ncbi:MAG: hypothetical protein Q9182_006136 [Xanthomendoza sp. 2 TL-2023]